MKQHRIVRLATAVCAAIIVGMALPNLAGAQQASGGNPPMGVQAPGPGPGAPAPAPAPVQLPHTGNPEAEAGGGGPAVLLGAAALLGLLVFRGGWVRAVFRRRQR